jgi:hypothetical protein
MERETGEIVEGSESGILAYVYAEICFVSGATRRRLLSELFQCIRQVLLLQNDFFMKNNSVLLV